jgi:hypothetical protein
VLGIKEQDIAAEFDFIACLVNAPAHFQRFYFGEIATCASNSAAALFIATGRYA